MAGAGGSERSASRGAGGEGPERGIRGAESPESNKNVEHFAIVMTKLHAIL